MRRAILGGRGPGPPQHGLHAADEHRHVERLDYVVVGPVLEAGDEVIVTYECTRTDGSRFRNTEVLTFEGEKIRRAEVYFGWELP